MKVVSHEPVYLKKVEDLYVLKDTQINKIRYHGDYHLGQVLKTAEDFVIFDFEGEPLRPLEERRVKHSPLRDVAGMLRSFNYAAYAGLFHFSETGQADWTFLERWGRAWEALVCHAFLKGYKEETLKRSARFLPPSEEMIHKVLSVFQLDKAMYELNYEINNRPSWLKIPIQGIKAATGGF